MKSPVVHNGDVPDGGVDSPQGVKRRSTIENGDGFNLNGGSDRVDLQAPHTPDSLDINDSHPMDEPIRRLDTSPSAGHKKLMELEEKPLMQVSSV